MFIPIRFPHNAYDLARPARLVGSSHGNADGRKDTLEPKSDARSFPPGLRDVGGELDRLLTRLAPSSTHRRSHAALGLDRRSPEGASVLTSTGAMAPAATSFEKVSLSFGNSTSVARLGGTYAGTGAAAAATSLTFTIDSNATIGGTASPVAFSIADQTGTTLFSYAGSAKAGETISLGSDLGLTLTFETGSLVAGSSNSSTVFSGVATTLNPDAKFGDANLNARPRFDGGLAVGVGSFTVNGKTIEVGADDSVTSIVRRINETVPELLASYSDERLTLTTHEASDRAIVVGDDSSGFLAATKLLGAGTDVGFVREDRQRLADLARTQGVQAGSFKVGGVSVAVDPTVDSIASLLARMSAAAPGVTGQYDPESDKVVLRGGEASTLLEDDTSGFLSAMGLALGKQLAEREGLSLDPGVRARIGQDRARQDARLVSDTVAALEVPKVDPPVITAAEKLGVPVEAIAASPEKATKKDDDEDDFPPDLPLAAAANRAFGAKKARAAYRSEPDRSIEHPAPRTGRAAVGLARYGAPPPSEVRVSE